MKCTSTNTVVTVSTTIGNIEDLPLGTARLVRVDGQRLCVVRTGDGVHAVDNACPHEGYGLTQGTVNGTVLTCQWHNWKFDLIDGTCLVGEEGVTSHPVEIGADGQVTVSIRRPEPAEQRETLMASLRRGVERDYVGQIARDTVRLLQAGAAPAELVWLGVEYGAPRAEDGWGHTIAGAADCLAMVDLFDGDDRALPVVQALAGISETERDRPARTLPEPLDSLPDDPRHAFGLAVEAEDIAIAQQVLRAGIRVGLGPDEIRPWFTDAVCAHHLSYGHGAIYAQKGFQLLDRVGWHRADTVLGHLVPTIVLATREDRLPYMRRFADRLAQLDLADLAAIVVDPSWPGREALAEALLAPDKRFPFDAVESALRAGAGVDGLLDAAVVVASERMLRYDTAGERDLADDFQWLDLTHGLTYVNAARWHHRDQPGNGTLRLALFCVFLAHFTGRHEWHTDIGPRHDIDLGASDLYSAGVALQREALRDHTHTFLYSVHAVKTARAAAEESVRIGDSRPLQAATRFVTAPKSERRVAAAVTLATELLAGRAPGRE